MTNELRSCPFCGIDPSLIGAHKPECYFRRSTDTEGECDVKWNTRPIEDALITEKNELRLQIAKMGIAVKEIKEALSEINYWTDWAYCDGLCDKAIKVSLSALDKPK